MDWISLMNNILGWVTIIGAIGGGLLIILQGTRSLGHYEQRFIVNERRLADLEDKLGPDFDARIGRDDERWLNLFARLDNMDDRLDRIEQNGKGKHV